MILPEDFPYITSICVNDCYTYQNFNIDLIKHQPFSHLILTGKNGSGKSTILKNLNFHILSAIESYDLKDRNYVLKNLLAGNTTKPNYGSLKDKESWKNELFENERINPSYLNSIFPFLNSLKNKFIYSYVIANRNSKVNEVKSPTKQEEFNIQLEQSKTSSDFFTKNFKQFLVNKKVNQVFSQLDNNKKEVEEAETFFLKIEEVFSQIFNDKTLKLVFVKDSYEFLIKLSDGRKLTFNILPDGFSAFLSILMDLFVRLDLIRKIVGNNNYNPCGIVLIDEPETHLHISLQYHILPILTTLFPNVQFIVATHSPAIISSIKNSTIFDLTTKETLSSDDAIGKSFSELMISHFGLDNEFSDFTDDLFEKVNTVLKDNKNNIPLRNQQLKAILKENERYISPTMRFELEAKISE